MLERLVSDHDVTLDPQREMEEYSSVVVEYNAANLGFSREVMERLLIEAKNDILKKPEVHGWIWRKDELIVMPITSDNYQFNVAATRIVLENLSRTSFDAKKRITNWGGIPNYLNGLSASLYSQSRSLQ